MRILVSTCLAISLALGLAACGEEKKAELPPPAQLTREAIGYYCNMTVVDHRGPKGQIQLKGQSESIWFSSARDTVAFTLLPEEPKDIAAIYVTDMSRVGSWEDPENNTWIDARTALYVTGSSKQGSMGAPEPVPFSSREAAEKFSHHYGGEIVAFSDIPKDSILGMVEVGDGHENMEMSHDAMEHETMEHETMEHDASTMSMDQNG